MEFARGIVGDPPWPELFATLAFASEACELVVDTGAQVHRVAFANQAVIAASSPLASDSVLRVMRTCGFITPAMMPTVASRVAATPSADPIEVLAEMAQLSPETALLMRRRAIAVAATRVFTLVTGSYRITSERKLPIKPGAAIDVRALIYEGVRTHLTDDQLADTVTRSGSSFVLCPEVGDDLPRFGFSPAEMPVVDELCGGASLADLAFRYPEVGARGVHAIALALLAAHAIGPVPRQPASLPRASAQYPMQTLARSSEQVPAQRISDRVPVQRTTGQFATQAPVTGRFAPRTGTTGVFDTPPAPSLEVADEPPRARTTGSLRAASPGDNYELAEQPRSRISGTLDAFELAAASPPHPASTPGTFEASRVPIDTFELAEQPRSRRSNTFEVAEPPGELADEPPRSFTTKPPTTGVFAVPVRGDEPSTAPPPGAPAMRASGEFAVSIRPPRPTGQSAAVKPPAEARPPEVTASQHHERGMALLDHDLVGAIAALEVAALISRDVHHEAMLAWAQFRAAPDKATVARATRSALAKAIDESRRPSLAHLYLGRMERMLGRDREALAQFKSVVDLIPDHAEALAEIRWIEAHLTPKK